MGVRVEADAETAGHEQLLDLAGRGWKLRPGSSALMRHSMAAPRADDVVLLERQRLAGGDADLRLDQVDAGDHLGHGMLDLDAGVDLDEVEVVPAGRR